jgi:hypothetical protein
MYISPTVAFAIDLATVCCIFPIKHGLSERCISISEWITSQCGMTLLPVAVVREEGKLWREYENVRSFLTDLELRGEYLQIRFTEQRQYLYHLLKPD